ncbi:MAG: folate-binding protein [Lysobacteraceae bacterium]|nr:MAG: folate-binding protein [Xanthomonadaceae bacterium]
MPDNLPPADARFFALPDHGLVSLDGQDATAFAQAQFANDVIGLADGHWQWNAWLTPKGRVIAVFALLKPASDRILLVVPDASTQELATRLQQFVFRRKLKIAARDDLHVGGAFGRPVSAANARIDENGDAIALDYGDDVTGRILGIAPQPMSVDPELMARWLASDLRAGLPRLPAGQREQWTPQQLSLERLQAFSVKKGCYPGQEIVARTHFLGKAKRGLVLLEADGPVGAGMEVQEGDRAIGTLVSASTVADTGAMLALAVLPLDRPAASLCAGTARLGEIPLQGGLQR